MLKHDTNDLKPCPHMQTLVSAWVDDALNGLLSRYTEWHVRHCPRCSAAVPVLRALQSRLHQYRLASAGEATLTSERRAALQEAWERADQAAASSSGSDAP